MKRLKDIFKSKTKIKLETLNKWNLAAAGLLAVQGVLILVLGKSYTLPVSTNYLTADPLADGARVAATRNLFDINIIYLVAAFLFVAAIAHLLVATRQRKMYETDLKNKLNKARWEEYATGGAILVATVAMVSGVYDISSLLMVLVLSGFAASMGLVMELNGQKNKKFGHLLPGWIGAKAGLIPLVVIAIYLWGAGVYGTGRLEAFVYWAFGVLVALFIGLAVNFRMNMKAKGKWGDYLYAEKAYIILSVVGFSAIAWIIFFGALR